MPLGNQSSGGWLITIPPEEVARRLSSFVLQKPPSTALTAAVIASAPRTNEDVGQLTDGLLLDEASLDGRHAFYRWWLELDTFASAQRDAKLFPAFTPAVAAALVDQVLMFAEDVTWRPQGDLTTLLTEPAAFVTSETVAWFPGVSATPGAAATRVALDATYYAGLFTQPAVVATIDYLNRAKPSGRGRKVRGRYSCQPIPLDPSNDPAPPIPMGKTIRQSNDVTVSQASCAACHSLTDPPGYSFGHFDAVGAFQDTEGGLPVDTSGVMRSFNGDPTGAELSFTGAADLASQLAALPTVRACFAAKWLAFSTGQYAATSADSLSVSDDAGLTADADYVVKRATLQGRLNLRGTIRAVTETHTFLDP